MSILEEICAKKMSHVSKMKQKCGIRDIKALINEKGSRFIFEEALRAEKENGTPSIIAEIKKASPSKGVIRDSFDPKEIAKNYEEAGATCISCLTDEPYFQGRDHYLKDVKAVSTLPVLRKDFMVDLYQIYESRALGADAVLLIMAVLEDNVAQEMYALATQLGMSALFEVHTLEELNRALTLNPRLIGVNNRNLKTMEVSLDVSFDLAPLIPEDILKISESGITSAQDIQSLSHTGFDGFLIGETLMKTQDESDALRILKNATT